jgi:hypothetical protein
MKKLQESVKPDIVGNTKNTLGNVNYVTAVALRCIGGDNICYVLQTSRSHMML